MDSTTKNYHNAMVERVRDALSKYPDVEEKVKMGGLSFMQNGKLCMRVQGEDLMIRCEPEMTNKLLTRKGARRYEMRGKPQMKGWLLISPEGTEDEKDFRFWIGITLDFNNKN